MNRLLNATFLDGVTGWGGPAIEVDETELGAPNRRVLKADGYLFDANPIPLDGAAGVYVSALHVGAVKIYWQDAGGVALTNPLVPLRRVGRGTPARGIASTLSASFGYMAAPATAARAQLAVEGPLSVVFRPSILVGETSGQCWRPGPHLNPDLDLPSFPAIEPQRDGLELEPIPLRKSFAGDAGVPTTRLLAATSRRYIRVEYALDAIGRDVLDQFWRENHPEFWFVRPDNGDLVIAEWADDGDPKDSGAGAARRTSIRLLIRDS